MNIGRIIVLCFVAFAAFIGSMVVQAYGESKELVRDDYYENELQFDNQRQEIENYNNLDWSVSVTQQQAGVVLTFPEVVEGIEDGTILFYRPDDSALDRDYSLDLNKNNQQIFEYKEFLSGNYEITIRWSDGDRFYIYEDVISFA